MRFRRLFAIAAVVLASACADSDSTPTGPAEAVDPGLQNSHAPPGCPSPVEIRLRIAYLFKQPGQAAIAQLKFTAIQLAMIARKPAIAQGLITPAQASAAIDAPPASVKAAPRLTAPARPWPCPRRGR